MAKEWRGAQTPDEVRQQVEADVPPGSDKAEAQAWLEREGIAYSDEGDVLRFTLKGPSRGAWVGVTWVCALLVPDGTLAEVVVEEGLTGP